MLSDDAVVANAYGVQMMENLLERVEYADKREIVRRIQACKEAFESELKEHFRNKAMLENAAERFGEEA